MKLQSCVVLALGLPGLISLVACTDDGVSTSSIAADTSIKVRVASSADDAEEYAGGRMVTLSSDLELTQERTKQKVGLRFQGVAIPRGATITSAYVQFTVDEVSRGPATFSIFGELVSNAAEFTAERGNISSRSLTNARVTWSPLEWRRVGRATSYQRTRNLAPVVQEIIDETRWESGNALALLIFGDGKRVAESYDGVPNRAPLLLVEWEPMEDPQIPPDPPIGTDPPELAVEVTAPAEGTTVSGTRTLTAVVTGRRDVSVQFRVDSENRCARDRRAPYSCQWDTTAEGDGTVSITALVTDPDGNEVLSAPVTVTVENGSDDPTEPPPPPSGTVRVPEDHATIQRAIDAAGDGDLVLVGPGTYDEGGLVINGKAITLASYYHTTGDSSFIARTTIQGGRPGVRVGESAAGTTVSGFTFTRGSKSVVLFGKGNVLNNHFNNNGNDAISLENTGGVIRGNYCFSPSDDCIDADGPLDTIIEDNVLVAAGDDGIEIRNYINRNPLVTATVTVTIRGNKIIGSEEDGIQIIDYTGRANRRFIIDRNEIRDSTDVGIGLMDNAETIEDFRAASMPERIHVTNNTLSGNHYGITGGDNLFAVNNIIANCSHTGMKNVDGDSVVAYNLFFNNGTNHTGSNVNTSTTLTADPRFTDDFTLSAGSPAVDAGTNSYDAPDGSPVVNIPRARYQGDAPDLGAYEQ